MHPANLTTAFVFLLRKPFAGVAYITGNNIELFYIQHSYNLTVFFIKKCSFLNIA